MSKKTISHQVSALLYLVRQECGGAFPKAAAPAPQNHICVVDCSGSMWGDLPKLRADLKKKLPTLLREGDTLSLVWFSGRSEFGVLFEGESVAKPTDLKRIEQAIDRWLKPCSLTGFVEPLAEVSMMTKRLLQKTPGSECSLFFMSDGMDNTWPRQAVLDAVGSAAGSLASSTFVEYGYYADRALLAAMAARAGGTLLFAKDFQEYEPQFSSSMRKKATAVRRVVDIAGVPVGGVAFALHEGEVLTFDCSVGTAGAQRVYVPADVTEIFYLATEPVGETGTVLGVCAELRKPLQDVFGAPLAPAYAAVSLFSVRSQPKTVKALLGALGDVRLVDSFAKCFGKQAYSVFMGEARACAFEPALRWSQGYDGARVPRDDAFTVLDMLQLLASDDENKLLVDHPSFQVDRIGRKRISRESALTDDEEAAVDALKARIAATRDGAQIAKLSTELAKLLDKPAPLKFVADKLPQGVSIASLTYNQSTPNVSFLVKREGYVDITRQVRASKDANAVMAACGADPACAGVDEVRFPTFIYRNYAVVKDGLLNVASLPMSLSKATMEKLFALHGERRIADGVVKMMIEADAPGAYVDFSQLPLCNGRMVESVSAKEAFEREWELVQVQARQKVYKHALSELVPTRGSATFVQKYGQAGADFLRDLGFTDYSGFGPKTVLDKARDYYMCKTIDISLKGFGKLPSMKELEKGRAKMTPAMRLMSAAEEEIEKQRAKLGPHQDRLAGWLKAEERAMDVERRRLIREQAQTVFAMIVGQASFTESAAGEASGEASDVTTLELVLDTDQGMKFAGVLGTAKMGEEKVEI